MNGSSFVALRMSLSSAAMSDLRGSLSFAMYCAGVATFSWPFMAHEASTENRHGKDRIRRTKQVARFTTEPAFTCRAICRSIYSGHAYLWGAIVGIRGPDLRTPLPIGQFRASAKKATAMLSISDFR